MGVFSFILMNFIKKLQWRAVMHPHQWPGGFEISSGLCYGVCCVFRRGWSAIGENRAVISRIVHSLPFLGTVSVWGRHHGFQWRLLHALVALVVLCALEKQFFYAVNADGFTQGVLFIDKLSLREVLDHPLYLVHVLRYVAVWPLWIVHGFAVAPLLNALFMLGVLWPLASIPMNGRTQASPWRVALFYLPCLLSMRSVMVTAGIGYLFVLFVSQYRSRLMFVVSALCVNLSSAGVLLWLIACAGNVHHVFRLRLTGLLVVLVMVGSLSISILHKYHFFHEGTFYSEHVTDNHAHPVRNYVAALFGMEGDDATLREMIGQQAWWIRSAFFAITMLDNSTVVMSLTVGNYTRALVYLALLMLYVYCLKISLRGGQYEKAMFFFLALSFPMFLTEGLGVIALVSPMVLLVLERSRVPRTDGAYEWQLLDSVILRLIFRRRRVPQSGH